MSNRPARKRRLAKKPAELAPERRKRLRMTIDGGRIEVHHLMSDAADTVLRFDSIELRQTASEAEMAAPWIQIGKSGRFVKTQGGKRFQFELNSKVFEEVIRNFEATQNRAIPIDFEHASEQPPTAGNIPSQGAPAQGWITELRAEGGNLYGRVNWGDKARQMIANKEYRYLSPAIRLGAEDRNTGAKIGAVLSSVALTNIPFLDGMMPIAASDKWEDDGAVLMARTKFAHGPNDYMPQLRTCMRLSELATPAEMKEHLGRIRDHLDSVDGDHTANVYGVNLADHIGRLRDAMQVPMGTTVEDLIDLVEDLIDAAIDEHEILYHGGEGEAPHAEMTNKSSAASSAGEEETPDMSAELLAKIATLELTNKSLEARAVAAEGEVVTLKAWRETRETQDLQHEVDAAYLTYKDKHGLKEDSKQHMLVMLKASPESFRALYPAVTGGQAYLLRDAVSRRPEGSVQPPPVQMSAARSSRKDGGFPVIALADKIQADHTRTYGTQLDRVDAMNRAMIAIRDGLAG